MTEQHPLHLLRGMIAGAAGTRGGDVVLAPRRTALGRSELLIQMDEMLAALRGLSIGFGDAVAIVLPNGPEMGVSFLAVAAAAACAPLNPSYKRKELEFFLGDLGPRALILAADDPTPARDIANDSRIPIIELLWSEHSAAGRFRLRVPSQAAPADPAGPRHAPETALLLHTSGTTSRPKLVPLSQANLCASATNIAGSLGLTPADRCLNVMPLFHIHGLEAAVLASIASGGSVVCTPGFHAPNFLGWVEEFGPTWYTAVPTMHQALLARADEIRRPTSLRFIRSCSSALPPPVMAGLERAFGVPVVEAYGMTEAAHQVASNPLPPRERKPGSVGVPTGTRIAIVGENGEPLPAGQCGDVVIAGDNIITRYAAGADPDAFAGGSFRTGDLGWLDADGYVFLSGRKKEIVNRAGEKIAPREIDERLLEHHGVAEAMAFSVPDALLGEDLAAAVVAKPGATLSETELRNFLAGRVAPFKVPRRILLVDELPKGATGKPQRIGAAQRLGLGSTSTPHAAGETAAVRAGAERPTGKLAELWRGALKREALSPADDFFATGGDSLSALDLLAAIEAEFGVVLSIIDLLAASTFAQLAARIARDGDVRSDRRLAMIQAGGALPPFFCIGAGPLFRDLAAQLGTEQPFLGPQYPPLHSVPRPCRIEDIAAAHVRTIRSHQPKGPYALGGWCIDGLIAFETARQLRAQGQDVSLLVMFDTGDDFGQALLPRLQALRARTERLAARAAYHARMMYREGPAGIPAYLADRLRNLRNVRDLNLRRKRLKAGSMARSTNLEYLDVLALQHEAKGTYAPQRYDGDVLLLTSDAWQGRRREQAVLRWQSLVGGRLETLPVTGHHRDVFTEPHVKEVARILGPRLRRPAEAAAQSPA